MMTDEAYPAPECPRCGGLMRQRIAQKGSRAGRVFWGCLRYPDCKGTLDIGETGPAPHPVPRPVPPPSPTSAVAVKPVGWIAPRLNDGSRIRFLTGGGRLGIAEPDTNRHFGATIQENLSNWCLVDHRGDNQAPTPSPLSGPTRQALEVARKILTRGHRPVISPFLENAILFESGLPYQYVNPEETPDILFEINDHQHRRAVAKEMYLATLSTGIVGQPRDWLLDSPEEEHFFLHTFPSLIGPEALAYLHPQVNFANLLGEENKEFINSRVDFLFSPPGVPSIVIEIDGRPHEETKSADDERDKVLTRAGYEVIRIAARDAVAGVGDGFARIRSVWNRRIFPDHPPAEWAVHLVWKPALAARIQLTILYAIEQAILPLNTACWDLRILERDVRCGLVALQDLWEMLSRLQALYACRLCPESMTVTCVGLNGPSKSLLLGNETPSDASRHFLDLDVSAFRSYVLEPPSVNPSPFTGWGTRPLMEVCAANIPRSLVPPTCSAPPATLTSIEPEILTYFLQYIFRKRAFREGQLEAITRTLAGHDSLVLLPTGAGKSLIYQLAGLLLPGATMIIDPITSLIDDQIYNLNKVGIDRAVGITSQIENQAEREYILNALGRGEYFFCLVAPERLQTPDFRESCRALTVFTATNLWVIDEAHCVSEWGHDFRTAYLNIGRVARDLGRSGDHVPPLLALTGTASRAVLRDIQRELQITQPGAVITPRSFDRPELHYSIITNPSGQKKAALSGALQKIMVNFGMDITTFFSPSGRNTMGGLIFCPHVNGEYGVVEVARNLRDTFKAEVKIYCGTVPKGFKQNTWNQEKVLNALRFKENEFALLVCTKAFGMGIDKPNIRYTVHYGIPTSLESFYQEAGRAGRDRNAAYNFVIFSNDNPGRAERLLDPALSLEQVREIDQLEPGQPDDVSRMLFFHFNSFAGVEQELAAITELMARIGRVENQSVFRTSYSSDSEQKSLEKAVHRLHLLGIVNDYTLDYSARIFELQVRPPTHDRITEALIRYVQGYSIHRVREVEKQLLTGPVSEDDFFRFAARILVEFIYDVIERNRRTALREMYFAARDCRTNADVRKRLLDYLQDTKFSAAVEGMTLAGPLDRTAFQSVIQQIVVPSDADELRGSTIRLLESQPDSPALLLMRGFLELIIRPGALAEFRQFIAAGLQYLATRYAASPQEMAETKDWLIDLTREQVPQAVETVIEVCVEGDVSFARKLLRTYPDEALMGPAIRVLVANVASGLEILTDKLLSGVGKKT